MELNFKKEYILENDNVRLNLLKLEDISNLIEFSINEPEIWKYSLAKASGKENLENYIKAAIKEKSSKKSYPFIVFDKHKEKFCGTTRFYNIDIKNKCLSIGYTWYGKEFRGTGINKNCKFLLLEFAFQTLNMERVEFRADKDNITSINAMKSIGCKEEGVLRSNMFKPEGDRRDSIILSIIKREWNNGIKEMLSKKVNR